jgi:hypothetical protein
MAERTSRYDVAVINNSWNTAACPSVAALSAREKAVNSKNIIAVIVIIVVAVGGGAALYKLDDGHGNRTSSSESAKTASD